MISALECKLIEAFSQTVAEIVTPKQAQRILDRYRKRRTTIEYFSHLEATGQKPHLIPDPRRR